MTTAKAEKLIWDFLCRVSYLLAEDFKGDNRHISVGDLKLISYKTIETKNGRAKEILGEPAELPFRTRFLFNEHFPDTKRSYNFFNPANEANGIRWLRENVFKPIKRFDLTDFCDNGHIAHIDAIKANYASSEQQQKRMF